MRYKRLLLAILALVVIAAASNLVFAQPTRTPGECGEYMYWHDGNCADARDKKASKSWTDEILAKQWKP